MISDWELWACANQMVEQHGRKAIIKAGERLLELAAAGDMEGHITWTLIVERMQKLLREEPGPSESVQ